jgi:hypothetical protein
MYFPFSRSQVTNWQQYSLALFIPFICSTAHCSAFPYGANDVENNGCHNQDLIILPLT